ncbi:hypothetical protein DAPPUDRAFT_264753 [Daphnia pulex]|uniref:Uncharacterized protein n=1 Tax=Daphnia pulex TaxID=6669 RepID=E9HS98_DAPPU|nr:hypothetical protein DAPPUDRAFT_264753 [Daphnia pulex]|eukprot:EFX65384.1 hypothetical protein DAPPUDRAFT_264753 [Daphnia pulex]
MEGVDLCAYNWQCSTSTEPVSVVLPNQNFQGSGNQYYMGYFNGPVADGEFPDLAIQPALKNSSHLGLSSKPVFNRWCPKCDWLIESSQTGVAK